jgi:hypothetical protein
MDSSIPRIPGLHSAHRRTDVVATIGERGLRTALSTGALRPLWKGVVVPPGRWLDPLTRASAALLVAGDDAALTGPAAAVLHGCTAVEPTAVDVVVPPECPVRSAPGLTVHHVRRYVEDVVEVADLRALALDRVVADMLCTARPQDGLALADEALRRSGGAAEIIRKQIGTQIDRRLDPRGTVRGALLLDLASPRSASPAESWFRWRLIEAGFPVPEVNWQLAGIDGQPVYVLDLAWPQLRIAVEYDGYAAHVGREGADRARETDLRRRGWIVIRAAAEDLANPARLERALRAAFAKRGYTW